MRPRSILTGVHRVASLITVVILYTSCAEPPNREMSQAQGAIDAARAAGAEEYAADEFTAAIAALTQSQTAVGQRDYRLALSLAIDAFERAQQAARVAVEARANARGAAERMMAEAATLLGQARTRLADPAISRLPDRVMSEQRSTLDSADTALQESRKSLEADRYAQAAARLAGVADSIRRVLAALEQPTTPGVDRKRR